MNLDHYPIALKEVLFTKVVVQAIPGHEPPEDGIVLSPENSITVNQEPDKPHHFLASMTTIINKEKLTSSPYFIEIECIASLETNGTLSAEEELRGVYINAHSVCYGAIRETVAWLTARQPYGPLALGLSVLRTRKDSSEPNN